MEETPIFRGQKYPGAGMKRCQDMIRESLKTPKVKFMREQLEKSGCPVGDNFIKAVKCDSPATDTFSPRQGILLCSNVLRFQDEVNQVIIHELMHAFDECHAKVDWRNCAHHACSEI